MTRQRFGKSWVLWLVVPWILLGAPTCSVEDNVADSGSGDGSSDGSSDGTGGDPGGSDPGQVTDIPICDEQDMVAEPVAPALLLVVDRSGSMADPISDGASRSKMQDTKDALDAMLDYGDGGMIHFGWMPFPGMWGSCSPGTVQVDCAEDSVETIRSRIMVMMANGGTPTGETLENADEYDGLYDEERPGFVLLLTDGLPTCPNGGGSDPNPDDDQLAMDAVTSLYSHGIGTFVIGLGEDLNAANPDLLNQMAEAGGHARPGSDKYYAANSLEELQEVLGSIGEEVMSCKLKMDNPPDIPEWLWVFFDGEPATRDKNHVNGWDFDPVGVQIVFYGAACDLLKSGSVEEVKVVAGCGPPP